MEKHSMYVLGCPASLIEVIEADDTAVICGGNQIGDDMSLMSLAKCSRTTLPETSPVILPIPRKSFSIQELAQ